MKGDVRLPLDLGLANGMVAFGMPRLLSAESRAAIAVAAASVVDFALDDLQQLDAPWEALHARRFLPESWRSGATSAFLRGWAVALICVGQGLTDRCWQGPTSWAEAFALCAILEAARDDVHEIFRINRDVVQREVHALWVATRMDPALKRFGRQDQAFDVFAGRITHPYFWRGLRNPIGEKKGRSRRTGPVVELA